jgi:methylmalonyl-CoA/ethylmalonyl-CoA epimerase
MKLRLNHIGFVVENISEYTAIFEALGLDNITEAVENPLQKVSASFVNVFPAKDVHVELLESTDENSPITNFLKKRGGGLHHLFRGGGYRRGPGQASGKGVQACNTA